MRPESDNAVSREPAGVLRHFFQAAVLLASFTFLMFMTSPTGGDFAWSDAPRHALNGVFLRDFLIAMPRQNPKQYAIDYNLHYPALTILFYPPLFPVFLAGSYSVFGFSHTVAQGTVAFFHLVLGLAVYLLARRWMSHGYALAAALLLAGAPEIAFWARQVMLDIPAYAWLALSAVSFLHYLDRSENRYLWLTMLLFATALYTKQTSFFAAFAFTAGIIASQGFGAFRNRRVGLMTAVL